MKRFRSQEGAELLEAAITIPMILVVCVGIFEFGRAFQTWQVLTNAAREGARSAVISGTTDAVISQRVTDYMKGGALDPAAVGATSVVITRGVALSGTDTGTQIEIDYPFTFYFLNPVVQLVAPASPVGGAITMRTTAVMRNEFAGS